MICFLAAVFVIGAVSGLVCLVGLLFLPKSPRWPVRHTRDDDAMTSLRRPCGAAADIDGKIEVIRATEAAEHCAAGRASSILAPWVGPALVVRTVL